MTSSTITYLTACEHIEQLRREVDRHRLAAEFRSRRRPRPAISRLIARRLAPAATADEGTSAPALLARR